MAELKKQLLNIATESGYKLGDVTKVSETAATLLIPIIGETINQERGYITAEEAGQDIQFEDSGNIGTMHSKNLSDRTVFVRKGTLFRGATQPRSSIAGFIIEPNSKNEVPVACVYASAPIHMKSKVNIEKERFVDRDIDTSLTKGQSVVWNEVEKCREEIVLKFSDFKNEPTFLKMVGKVANDDICGLQDTIDKSQEIKDDIMDKIKTSPISPNQVGVIIMEENGVSGLEFYDSDLSWRTVHSKVLSSHMLELLQKSKEPKEDYKKEKVMSELENFIGQIDFDKLEKKASGANWATYITESDKVIAEYTWLNDRIIHAVALKK